jgi:DNA adenine methylase
LLPAGVAHLRHVEPFAGGAALFLGLAPRRALLADINEQLIETYRAVRDHLESVTEPLRILEKAHCAAQYCEVRALYNRQAFAPPWRALRLSSTSRT